MRLIVFAAVIFLTPAIHAEQKITESMPFWLVSDRDIQGLQESARRSGLDLKSAVERVYSRGKRIDEAALGNGFTFSLKLQTLDGPARAYGQLIYNSFVYLGEGYGIDAYSEVLNRQTPEVQQRIRDFLFYPVLILPAPDRDEARRRYPAVFPESFRFGEGDLIFPAAR